LISQLPSRLAVGSFAAWDRASQVANELGRLGFGSEKIFCLALLSILRNKPEDVALPDFVELSSSEGDEPVFCSPAPVAAKLAAKSNGGGRPLEELLRNWLLPRQAERIASYVNQRKIVLGIFLAKGDDERSACLALLAYSAAPVEIHDLLDTN
jgi:hypothetical protein